MRVIIPSLSLKVDEAVGMNERDEYNERRKKGRGRGRISKKDQRGNPEIGVELDNLIVDLCWEGPTCERKDRLCMEDHYPIISPL